MGATPRLFSQSSYDSISTALNNPNPENFEIDSAVQCGKHVVAYINYPDSTNYEGNKVLVFRNYTIERLYKRKSIDPHFSEIKKFKPPFARFEPTPYGYYCAKRLAKLLNKIR